MICWPTESCDAGRLRDEHRRQREVERRAVEVEAVAERQHERDDLARHAQPLDDFHRPRQRRFARRGRERDDRRLLHRLDELADRHLEDERDRQQDEQDEDREREVERGDEPRQVHQHAQPAVPDRVGDRRADADRRVVHDDVRELEHRLGHGLAPGDDRPSLLADHAERDREQDAEDDDLQHVAFGHRLDDRFRHDVEQDLIPGLRASR